MADDLKGPSSETRSFNQQVGTVALVSGVEFLARASKMSGMTAASWTGTRIVFSWFMGYETPELPRKIAQMLLYSKTMLLKSLGKLPRTRCRNGVRVMCSANALVKFSSSLNNRRSRRRHFVIFSWIRNNYPISRAETHHIEPVGED
jgi:hypothetical protein